MTLRTSCLFNQGTDDHFMAACFVAGAAGDWDDEELERGVLGAGMLFSFIRNAPFPVFADISLFLKSSSCLRTLMTDD
jgi:hypothetical protein